MFACFLTATSQASLAHSDQTKLKAHGHIGRLKHAIASSEIRWVSILTSILGIVSTTTIYLRMVLRDHAILADQNHGRCYSSPEHPRFSRSNADRIEVTSYPRRSPRPLAIRQKLLCTYTAFCSLLTVVTL